nr:MAG TPA: hypothetical protein [Caudoviricetes sp.]
MYLFTWPIVGSWIVSLAYFSLSTFCFNKSKNFVCGVRGLEPRGSPSAHPRKCAAFTSNTLENHLKHLYNNINFVIYHID